MGNANQGKMNSINFKAFPPIGLLITSVVILHITTAAQEAAAQQYMTPATLRELQQKEEMKDLTLVDVRSNHDFLQKHIDGAINIPFPHVGLKPLPKEGRTVLYCHGHPCPLGGRAAKELEQKGYENIWVLKGGLAEWERLGYPIFISPDTKVSSTGKCMELPPLSMKELRARIKSKDVRILDVRTAEAFKGGHLSGAKNIPLDKLEANPLIISKEVEWVIYDRHPKRGKEAVLLLQEAGFKARSFPGSLAVWSALGYPLEVGSTKE